MGAAVSGGTTHKDPNDLASTSPMETDVGPPPRQEEGLLCTDVRHALEDSFPTQEGESVVTVTQVFRGVQAVPAVSTKLGEVSLSQWLDPTQEAPFKNAPSTVEPVIRLDEDVDSCRKKLEQHFQDDEESDALPAEVARNDSDVPVVVPSATEDCCIADASYFVDYDVPGVYRELRIDEVIKAVPKGTGGNHRTAQTVIFNHFGKELIITNKMIRKLKEERGRLGNDIVDFVLSRLYMQADEERRRSVLLVSSRACESFRIGKNEERLGQTWLTPPSGVGIEEVKELIVPWIFEDHWSVLVFRERQVLHMDSCNGTFHRPADRHNQFLRWVYMAWQRLRGVPECSVTEVISVGVWQQYGGHECGHLVIRNIALYLKVRS